MTILPVSLALVLLGTDHYLSTGGGGGKETSPPSVPPENDLIPLKRTSDSPLPADK